MPKKLFTRDLKPGQHFLVESRQMYFVVVNRSVHEQHTKETTIGTDKETVTIELAAIGLDVRSCTLDAEGNPKDYGTEVYIVWITDEEGARLIVEQTEHKTVSEKLPDEVDVLD